MEDYIHICGARENNLCGIDLDLPKNKLIVVSGVSGSGKSSLAFHTIYAEGQRRYMESLSPYARQFLQIQDKPDIDSIRGLSPTIAINQKSISKNPRSNLATVTEIYDYMRLLYARIGIAYSPKTGQPIQSYTVSQIEDSILSIPDNSKFHILSPIVEGRKGEHRKLFETTIKQGYSRFKIDGKVYESANIPTLDPNKVHRIFVVVDRLQLKSDLGNRLPSSISTALKLGQGVMSVEIVESGNLDEMQNGAILTFSEFCACPESGFSIAEIEPRMFSFNSPYGACAQCDGLGMRKGLDLKAFIADETKSIVDGAIAPLDKASYEVHKNIMQLLGSIAAHYQINLNCPWVELSDKERKIILFGSSDKIKMLVDFRGLKRVVNGPFEGIVKLLTTFMNRFEQDHYYSLQLCTVCSGFRLKQESLCVRVNNRHIGQVLELAVKDAICWFNELSSHLSEKHTIIAQKVIKEISSRLGFLSNLGLEYLQLNRGSATLSSGESQRIRLASQIGSGLTGVIYVLDEPSVGLHQRDNDMLISMLINLRDLGNTLIVVEHDEDTIMSADWVVEIGPGAGEYGGRLIFSGKPEGLLKVSGSPTGDYLSGRKQIPIKPRRRYENFISIKNASLNNLKGIDVDFPLKVFTCVTGVSGGGKSSLVINTLYKVVEQKLNNTTVKCSSYEEISGIDYIDKVIKIDQSPIGRTPLSNPATYTGVFNYIRDWYTSMPESKARGYKVGRYSFNVKGGRCEACSGGGMVKIEMHFLPDVYVKCDICNGKRYNRETLEITYKDKSISDVLDMNIDRALEFFDKLPLLREKLDCLSKVGLGYLRLGQYSTSLSGGEAQRIKLAKELSKQATGKTLYILDEPTTGLHIEDINRLLKVLNELVDKGNTVVVIEHNLHVIKSADYVLDIGPESGEGGGKLVACGTPEEVASNPDSITGRYLAKYKMPPSCGDV